MGAGVGGEAAAVVVITLLAIVGNALVVTTLLRRSLLHHPSNRLVLSLTASNLVLAVVVLPGLVASVVMGPSEPPLLKVLPSPLGHLGNESHVLTPSPSSAPSGHGLLGHEGVGWERDVVRSFGRSWDAEDGPSGVSLGGIVKAGGRERRREEEHEAMQMEVSQVAEEDSAREEENEEGEMKEEYINQKDIKAEQEGPEKETRHGQVALTLEGVNKMEAATKQASGHVRKDSEQGREITRIKASARIRGKPVNIKLSINYVGALERQSEQTAERRQTTQSDTSVKKTEERKTGREKIEQKTEDEKTLPKDNLHIQGNEMKIDIEQEEKGEEENVETSEWESKQRKIIPDIQDNEGKWDGAEVLCQSAAFLTNFVTAASAITVAVIALDRYLAIVRPMVYGIMVTGHRCLLMLAWCWGQALLTALPPLFGWSRYERHGPEGRCGVQWARSPSYTAVWVTSVFVVPVIVMLVCYYFILQVARNKCRRIHVGTMLGAAAAAAATSPPVTPDPSSVCLEVPHLSEVKRPSSICEANGLAGGPRALGDLLDAPGRGGGGGGGGGGAGGGGGVPCRSLSVSIVNKIANDTGSSYMGPKRKLGDCGRSLSFCQPQQPVKPVLRRVQSTLAMRPSFRKKFSLGRRKPSWSWEASPAKGFRTVCVVVGTHVFTWAPYSFMAVAEAVLGVERVSVLPHWIRVTSTLLLFTASVFYPIVYGLYNRSIRKEVVTCLCPISSRARRRGSLNPRPSTLNSFTEGSVLDFSSLRHRELLEKPLTQCPNSGLLTAPIPTISGSMGMGGHASPHLPPIFLMTDYDHIPTRGYNLNARKPSQDSGAVMVSGDDPDYDPETPSQSQSHLHLHLHPRPTRRVSAPSVLGSVREDPPTPPSSPPPTPSSARLALQTTSCGSVSPAVHRRKMAMTPLSLQVLAEGASKPPAVPLRRVRSLDKLPTSEHDPRDKKYLSLPYDRSISRYIRKKQSLSPLVRETSLTGAAPCERLARRKGSMSILKVVAIPEDCGGAEGVPEVPDSGRGSVDSGEVAKARAQRQISIDEGIGAECLAEEDAAMD
ncbi:uncharacterized protein LOC122253994 isoform X2 [Penaeus japonicus]|uniref:uncharacterized protein LOC122253994 isoform X2 n=1 Tax=Penaeus japonicus TaxID=27405 RepID=UPI001C7167A7|nr:uncharacterized protein LOC122253994 isoform X2 [Penaeus japonicus]